MNRIPLSSIEMLSTSIHINAHILSALSDLLSSKDKLDFLSCFSALEVKF